MNQIEPIRLAARQLVRELHLLDSRHCVEGFSFSECHLITELESLGQATAKELGSRLVLEKSTMSRLIAGLLHHGYVEAREDKADRRRKLLQLTDRGQAGAQRIHSFARQQVSDALAYVSEKEATGITRGLSKYANALKYARLGNEFTIRPIGPEDNPQVAVIIREVMTEFGAVGEGYSIQDNEVDHMYEAYPAEDSVFYVIENQGRILGCGGIGPLQGGEPGVCELRKMYFLPELRGTGMGSRLLGQCLEAAQSLGYRACYLETLETMTAARRLYRKFGFKALDRPMGNTGHCGCDAWMAKSLTEQE